MEPTLTSDLSGTYYSSLSHSRFTVVDRGEVIEVHPDERHETEPLALERQGIEVRIIRGWWIKVPYNDRGAGGSPADGGDNTTDRGRASGPHRSDSFDPARV